MKKYSIGHFAKSMGLNTQTLRYYEKLGIIRARKAKNGYRYYSGLDSRAIMESKRMASLGFSLEEIRDIFVGSTIEEYRRQLQKKQEEYEAKIERLQAVNYMQKAMLNSCDEMCTFPDVVRVEKKPLEPAYFAGLTDQEELQEQSYIAAFNEKTIEMLPMTIQCVHIDLADMLKEENTLHYSWGIMLFKRFYREDGVFSMVMKPMPEYDTFVTMISWYKDLGGYEINRERFQPMLTFIKENGLRIIGDVKGILLPAEYGAEIRRCTKFYIPVEYGKSLEKD